MKRTISAFMDGEADHDEALRAIQSLTAEDETFREDWAVYHLIRDAMQDRSCAHATRGRDAEIGLAEAGPLESEADPVARTETGRGSSHSWKVVPYAMALVLLIAAVTLVELFRGAKSDAELGWAGEVSTTEMRSDSTSLPVEIDEYLMAHQGFSARGTPGLVVERKRSGLEK